MPVAQAIAAISFVDETPRRRAVSRIQSGGPLAATLGIPLLTAIAGAFQWRGAFIVVSGCALAVALILWRILSCDHESMGSEVRLKSILAAYRPLIRDHASLILIVAACLENAGVNAMWTYYGAFYVQQYSFSTEQVGWDHATGAVIATRSGGQRRRATGRASVLFIVVVRFRAALGLSLILPLPAAAAVVLMAAGWLMHG
jgi:predicted MFS family arabinose efflux permease